MVCVTKIYIPTCTLFISSKYFPGATAVEDELLRESLANPRKESVFGSIVNKSYSLISCLSPSI